MNSGLNYLCIRSFLIQFVPLNKIVSQILENRSNRSRSKARNWFCLFVLFWSVSHQVGAQLKVDFGPKAGVNASLFRGDFEFEGMARPKFGFTAGGFLNVRSTKKKNFQFEADVLFTLRGNNSDYLNTEVALLDPNTGQENKSYTIGYLEFPLLFKYTLGASTFIRPFVMAGPTYSGIWFANYKTGDFKKDVQNDILRDDFGLTIGGGISWFFLDRWYFLDLRYFHGFLNASERLNRNLDPYDPNISGNPIKGKLDVFTKDGAYYNSSLYITFAVSLSKQAILKY
jgi:hypothetical protein